MKQLALYGIVMCCALSTQGQYYFRGEVKSDKNQPLQNVKIFAHSSRQLFQSGNYGGFGFNISVPYDSITFSLEGYKTQSVYVKTSAWQNIVLTATTDQSTKARPKLISITKDRLYGSTYRWFTGNETYFELIENGNIAAAKYPTTGFSLNINTASYSNVRRFLNMSSPVPPDAVRVEEMMNYFNLYYDEPPVKDVFSIRTQLGACPWNAEKQLLFINVNAKKLDLNKVAPSNFVFLIDVSGSMDDVKRLPLLQAAFKSFVKNLRPQDKVSIVTYGGTVAVWLQPTSGSEKEKILKSIEELTAAGDTPGESAIRMAYGLAQSTFIKGGNNRVILATDGDFNVGEVSNEALEKLIIQQKQSGVFLTCLGVGMGNLKDSKLQTLAKNGNGNYAYLDDQREAEKVLITELTQNFYAVADDVNMNVTFNPAMVKEYRLIGFDNKREALTDIHGDLEGGEIGSGNSTLALFEILPTELNKAITQTQLNEDIGRIDLKYGQCNDSATQTLPYHIVHNYQPFAQLNPQLQLAASITAFGLKLKHSPYIPPIEWEQIKLWALACANKSDYLQNEFIGLIDKAQKIYPEKKKKRKRS